MRNIGFAVSNICPNLQDRYPKLHISPDEQAEPSTKLAMLEGPVVGSPPQVPITVMAASFQSLS